MAVLSNGFLSRGSAFHPWKQRTFSDLVTFPSGVFRGKQLHSSDYRENLFFFLGRFFMSDAPCTMYYVPGDIAFPPSIS
jgi:hypothetical protein